MKRCIAALGILLISSAFAEQDLASLLNKVTLQLHSEQWVTTKTALVNVSVNAALTNQGLEKIQSDVIAKLNRLVNGVEWHILSFDRQLDKSGLESVQVTAQARLQQSAMAGLRDKAKTISQPGMTFTIDQIQFTPSEEELRQANSQLRSDIYQQAQIEAQVLNKMYPTQNYYLYQINFISSIMPMPQAALYTAKMTADNAPTSLSIGNKQELRAIVVLASQANMIKTPLVK